jgi:hypothetical protein
MLTPKILHKTDKRLFDVLGRRQADSFQQPFGSFDQLY